MLVPDYEGEMFYQYVQQLCIRTGHTLVTVPIYANHTPEQFFYLDNHTELSLTQSERALFTSFYNVSLLFCANDCWFISANLFTERSMRSQLAHDVHTLIHMIMGANASVCFFRHEEEVILSLVGYNYQCILSDWYPIDDDYDTLASKLCVANMSITDYEEYFVDMVYALGRRYYFSGYPSRYDLLPVDCLLYAKGDLVSGDIDELISKGLSEFVGTYGDDYVEYCETKLSDREEQQRALDSMLLSMLNAEGEYASEMNSEILDDSQFSDENLIDDIEPELFQDAELLLKWIRKKDQ